MKQIPPQLFTTGRYAV